MGFFFLKKSDTVNSVLADPQNVHTWSDKVRELYCHTTYTPIY